VQNRLQFDSEFCGRVPLNQTNLIQPHGALLVLDRDNRQILQCSENAESFFGIGCDVLAGAIIDTLLPERQAQRLRERLETAVAGKFPVRLSVAGRELLFIVEILDNLVLLEAEAINGEQASFVDVYEQLKYVMAAIEQVPSVEEVARLIARELRAYSGFDKVMIYRFDAHWNGEVIAEACDPEMERYLGLFFPASDIPKQARELYRKNPYRLIPNIAYQPVKLFPILNPRTNAFTDLSNSNLRSVAGVHLEYLRNMGVAASMSTRILRNGELWGLIACHHRSPRYLSYQDCSVFELLSNFITARIESVAAAERGAVRAEGHRLLSRVVESVFEAGDMADGLMRAADTVQQLLYADGFALVLRRRVERWGSCPATTDVQDLVYWLQSRDQQGVYGETSLASVYEPAAAFADVASGLLVLPLQPEHGHYLLAFRKEALSRINWAGDPTQAIRFEADGKRYHPRNSFTIWQQKMVHTAPAWSTPEQEIGETFRQFLLEYLLRNVPA